MYEPLKNTFYVHTTCDMYKMHACYIYTFDIRMITDQECTYVHTIIITGYSKGHELYAYTTNVRMSMWTMMFNINIQTNIPQVEKYSNFAMCENVSLHVSFIFIDNHYFYLG